MQVPESWTIGAIGFLGALFGGTVGIGGALILIPLLLYLPPLVSGTTLTVQTVSGLSIVLVVAGSLVGALAHGSRGHTSLPLLVRVGLPMQAAGVLGGAAASVVSPTLLLVLFALLATVAAGLLVVPEGRGRTARWGADRPGVNEPPGWPGSLMVGGGVGLVAGLLGAGGAFLLLPLLIRVLHIPVRDAVGTSLGITLMGSSAALVGKVLTAQVPLDLVPWALLGVIPGSLLGAQISHRLPEARLRQILVGLVTLSALRTWWEVLLP